MSVPGRSRQHRSSRPLTVVIGAIALSAAGECPACSSPDDSDPLERPARVYVIPPNVSAEPGKSFVLRARVIDSRGHAEPKDKLKDVKWVRTGDPSSPSTGEVLVVNGPTTSLSYDVSYPGAEGTRVVVNVATPTSPSAIDWVRAEHQPNHPPAIVLVDGKTEVPLSDTLIGVAGIAALDYLTCYAEATTCGEVTLFSPTQGVHRLSDIDFTGACETVEFLGGAPLAPECLRKASPPRGPRPLKTAIYVLGAHAPGDPEPSAIAVADALVPTPLTDEGRVEVDLTFARRVLDRGYSGVALQTSTQVFGADEFYIQLGEDNLCNGAPKPVKEQLDDLNITLSPGTITVVYVTGIQQLDLEEWYGNALTCGWDAAAGSIILISWSKWQPSLLAHELMHAIGPWEAPGFGHTSGVDGFTPQNILADGEDPTTPDPRSLLTLGQSFRFNLDTKALVHRAGLETGTPTFPCQGVTSTEDAPCPTLTKDVVRP